MHQLLKKNATEFVLQNSRLVINNDVGEGRIPILSNLEKEASHSYSSTKCL
jgi:hypothetical protein